MERILLQKNARCPECAGTLRYIEGRTQIKIRCINCNVCFRVVDTGMVDNEFVVEQETAKRDSRI